MREAKAGVRCDRQGLPLGPEPGVLDHDCAASNGTTCREAEPGAHGSGADGRVKTVRDSPVAHTAPKCITIEEQTFGGRVRSTATVIAIHIRREAPMLSS